MRNQNSRNRKTANFMVTGLLVFMALLCAALSALADDFDPPANVNINLSPPAPGVAKSTMSATVHADGFRYGFNFSFGAGAADKGNTVEVGDYVYKKAITWSRLPGDALGDWIPHQGAGYIDKYLWQTVVNTATPNYTVSVNGQRKKKGGGPGGGNGPDVWEDWEAEAKQFAAEIIAPSANKSFYVGETVPISAKAVFDPAQAILTQLSISIDGANVKTVITPVTGYDWDTTGKDSGTHTITVTAQGTVNGVPVSDTVNRTVTLVKLDKLQYRLNGQGEYSDVPEPLRVPVGSNVQFKALKQPANALWPDGKPVWKRSGANIGSGEAVTVSFTEASTSATEYQAITAECGNTLTANVLVVGIQKLQYRIDKPGADDDNDPFSNVLDPLLIPIGSTVIFKAVESPLDATWPQGKPVWSGNAGATGTGATKSVTFDIASTSPSDFKTVIAECGNSVTANIIVTHYKVEFSGQLINKNTLLRSCAGGIDDHDATNPDGAIDYQYQAHTRKVTAKVTLDGQTQANVALVLKFDSNKGHDYGNGQEKKTARLHSVSDPFDGAHPWQETLSVTTDVDGKISFWVKSGDVISQPTIDVFQVNGENETRIGQLACDFATAVSRRRFPDKAEYEEGDTGWLFYFPGQNQEGEEEIDHSYLADPGDTMPAKIYMKFQIDGVDEDGHWQYVNDHSMEMEITGVEKRFGEADDPDGLSDPTPSAPDERYVAFDNGIMKRTVVTHGDGSGQSMTIAGADIQDIKKFFIEATDGSVWEDE